MLASPLELNNSKFESQWARIAAADYAIEPKLDGMRLILTTDAFGWLRSARTRSGREVLPQVPLTWVTSVGGKLPRDAILDCEFGYQSPTHINDLAGWPRFDFNQTMRVMGSGPDEAQRKAEQIAVLPTALLFDIMQFKGRLLTMFTLATRRDVLTEVCPHETWVQPTESSPRWSEDIYDAYVKAGGEGLMVKNRASIYVPGKRPTQTWYKVKKFNTLDVIILGFQGGQGKYEGQIGAVRFGLYDDGKLCEVGQTSGMTDEMRRTMTTYKEDFIGKVMEIRYFGLTAGTPRHPQYLRMRDDRTPRSCTLDQIVA